MMNNVSLIQLARAIDAEYAGNNDKIHGSVSIDTRNLVKGQLFVAIKGEQVDGHDYVEAAFEAGAIACICEKRVSRRKNILIVKDTKKALLQMGRLLRNRFTGIVTGVTGSCGKTSVKEMLTSIFSLAGSTLATEGNYNNDIGMPIILSRLDDSHQFAVIEMGTNAPGEIGTLAQIARPQIAVITNAEAVHIERLKSVEGVAIEKGAIVESLPEEGTAVLNRDSRFFSYWSHLAEQQKSHVISFSLEDDRADAYASDIRDLPDGVRFTLHFLDRSFPMHLDFFGKHQVSNACAATAAALAAGISPEIIVQGLHNASPFQRRGQQFTGVHGARIIDESYNANPTAVKAAMDMLANRPGKRIFVLGDMGELGSQAIPAHSEVGEYARNCGIDRLMTHGDLSQNAAKAFGEGASSFNDKKQLIRQLHQSLTEETTVLIKGSNYMKMNEIVSSCLKSGLKETNTETQRSI